MATTQPRLSLSLALLARVMRSRVDALAYARAELQRPSTTVAYKHWLAGFFLRYGGNADLMIGAAPDSIRETLRRAYAIPEIVVMNLPRAEELYALYLAGYRNVPLPKQKVVEPKKSALWMQILEPAGSNAGGKQ